MPPQENDLRSMHGALRSLMHEPAKDLDWSSALIALVERAHSLSPGTYQDEWMPYLHGFRGSWPEPLLYLRDVPRITRLHALLPDARWAIYLKRGSKYSHLIPDFMHSPILATLHTLEFAGIQIFAEGARVLAQSPHLRTLRALSIPYNRVGDAGVQELIASPNLTSLTSLNLSLNAIGAKAVGALVRSPLVSSLTHLDLSSNYIGDDGARAIAGSPELSSLTSLNLAMTKIGPDGARALRDSTHLLPSIAIDLEGCAITPPTEDTPEPLE